MRAAARAGHNDWDGSGEISEVLYYQEAKALLRHIFLGQVATKYDHLAFYLLPAAWAWPSMIVRIPLNDSYWTPVATATDAFGIDYHYVRNTTTISFPTMPSGPPVGPGQEGEDPENFRLQEELLLLGERTGFPTNWDDPEWQFYFELNPPIVIEPGDSPRAIKPGGLTIRIVASGTTQVGANQALAGRLFAHLLGSGVAPVVTSWYINLGTMVGTTPDPVEGYPIGGTFQPVQAADYTRLAYNGWGQPDVGDQITVGWGVYNTKTIKFGMAGSEWGTVTHFRIENFAGSVAFLGQLPEPVEIKKGYQFSTPPLSIMAAIR